MSGPQTTKLLEFQNNHSAMDDLSLRCGLPDSASAAAAFARIAPVVVETMTTVGRTQPTSDNLLEMAQALTWAERDTPEVLFNERSRFNGGLSPLIFGGSLDSTIANVGRTEKLNDVDASTLLESVSVVTLAVMAGHPLDGLSEEKLAATFAANTSSAPSAPIGAPAQAAAPVAAAPVAAAPVEAAAPVATPEPQAAAAPQPTKKAEAKPEQKPVAAAPKQVSEDSKSKMPLLVGGAVALLALGGIGFFALSGGGGDSEPALETTIPDAVAFEDSVTTTTQVETVDSTEPGVVEPVDAEENLDEKLTLRVPMSDIADPDRNASGVLNFTFDTTTGAVCYSVESINIQGPYRSHIHVGGAGEKGGIVVDLGPLESGDVGCVDNLPIDTKAILANRSGHYAELHDISEEWTIRGQLSEALSDDIVNLSVPMEDIFNGDRGASGVLNFEFDTVTGRVCYGVESINIEGPYRTHIHVGEDGEKGGIVVDMGSLTSGDTGCVENLPVDTKAILANKSGHYAELHDISEEWTIRGQLSEATTGESVVEEPEQQVDAEGGGASIVLRGGTVFLEGAVPDQATADDMSGSLSGIDSATPVVNNLTVEAGAPLPSGRVVIADAVFFAPNSDEVKTIDDKTLAAITALALSRDDWILTVVGHTDSIGSDVSNLELSLRRASALRDLLAKQGVPEDNLRVRGAGETAPIGDNNTAAGRAENRRIEFEFTPSS